MSQSTYIAAEAYVYRDSNPLMIRQAAVFQKLSDIKTQNLPRKEEVQVRLALEKELEVTREALEAEIEGVAKSIEYKKSHPATVLQEGYGLRKRRDLGAGTERRKTKFSRWWMEAKKR